MIGNFTIHIFPFHFNRSLSCIIHSGKLADLRIYIFSVARPTADMPTPAPIAPANARTRMFDAYEDGEISGATFDRLVTQRAAAIAAELQALGVGPIRVGRPFLEESDEEVYI